MKKMIASFLFSCIFLTSCLSFADNFSVRVGGLTGPTAMSLSGLLEHDDQDRYEFALYGTADELTPLFIKNEVDIISVPVNLGSVLYNKLNGDVVMLAVNTLGVLYILEKGGTLVDTVVDLKGKIIYATGKGTTPEYTLRYLLKMNSIDPDDDVEIVFKNEPAEIVAMMSATDGSSVCMLPQPYVTSALSKLENTRIALDVTEEWAKVSDTDLVTSAVFCRKSFAENNPEIITTFMDDFDESVRFLNENVAEAAKIIGDLGIVPQNVAEKAIPFCHVVCMTGEEMSACADNWLKLLYDEKPASVGDSLPGHEFYYSRNDG